MKAQKRPVHLFLHYCIAKIIHYLKEEINCLQLFNTNNPSVHKTKL